MSLVSEHRECHEFLDQYQTKGGVKDGNHEWLMCVQEILQSTSVLVRQSRVKATALVM